MSAPSEHAGPAPELTADAPGTAVGPAGPDQQRRRLHPFSPFLKGGKALTAVIVAISWQGYAQLGFVRWLLTLGAALLLAVAGSAVSWAATGYQVLGRELRIQEGLVWRRTRAIPLERVQAIDVVRPLMARLTGLAELRLEVIGASKTEAPLAYLSIAEAVQLRARLLSLSAGTARQAGADATMPGDAAPAASGTDAAAAASDTAAPPATVRPLHTVQNRDVLIGQLMTPQAWFVPIGLLLVAVRFAANPTLTFIGVATFLTALVGVAQVPVRRIFDHWNFHLWADPAGLRLRHGLLDTRNQTVPPLRIQAINVTRPLLWRPFGWLTSRIDVAGYGGGEAAIRAGVLLPVADAPTTRRVVYEILDGTDVATLPMVAPPRRARWLAPITQPYLGFALTADVVAARTGVVTPQLVIVPLARVQSVRVVQGPVQRRLGLASVHVDTAGRLHLVGEHRSVAEAYSLAITVSDRSRAARARLAQQATAPATQPADPDHTAVGPATQPFDGPPG